MCIRDRKCGAHPWLGHLRRESDLHVLIDVGTQMRLPRVDEERFARPAPAAVDTAPPHRGSRSASRGGVAANM
eukprot:7053635-Alexandrium_andersonii.AAC.1